MPLFARSFFAALIAAFFAVSGALAGPAYYSPVLSVASLQALGAASPTVVHAHVQLTNQNYTWSPASTMTPTADNVVVQATGVATGRWIVDTNVGAQSVLSFVGQNAPMLSFNNTGNPGITANLWSHDPAAIDPNAGLFSLKVDTNVGDNLPDSPIADTVWYLGYNINAHGGRADPTKAATALHWESFYIRNPTVPSDPPTQEWHLQFEGTDGVLYRPLSYLLDIDGGAGHGLMDLTDLSMFDWQNASSGTRQRIKFSFPVGGATTVEFFKNSTLFFDANGTVPMVQMNAAGNAYLSLPYYDSFNLMHLDNTVFFGSTMNYGGTTIAASTTGSGGLVLQTGASLISPQLGDAQANTFVVNTLSTNPVAQFTASTFAPGIAMTSGNNSILRPLLGTQIGAYVNSNNTGNYTGTDGVTGLFVDNVILSGAAGTMAAWHGEIIQLNNASASMAVTNAEALRIDNMTTAGGVIANAVGLYAKDQSNGGTSNVAALIGGSGAPGITGNWSLYVQGSNAARVVPPLTLNGALTYGGVTLSNSVTGTGSMVLSASPTFTGTLTAPSIVGTLALTVSPAYPDGTTSGNPVTLSPTITETTAPNSTTTPLRVATFNPTVLSSNTQNYTGANGIQGFSLNPQFQAGATGTVSNASDVVLGMTNSTTGTPLVITNATGMLVNLFSGTNGYTNIAGIYAKDQAGGSNQNISVLIGGSAAAPAIAGTWSLYVAGSNPIALSANVFTKGTIPTVTGTGSPTIATGSTDAAGEVTGGTLATSIVITFAAAKANAPFCVVTSQTQLAAFSYTISTTAITVALTATTGEKVDYNCTQH